MSRPSTLRSFAALAILIACAIPAAPSSGQDDDSRQVRLTEVPKDLPPVDFLAAPPAIDGVIDPALRALPRRTFSQADVWGAPGQPPDAHYRLAYGTDFLYVYVEAQGDALAYNDRAYQNGDGFHFVIARALPGNAPTNEFYVAACSAVNRPDLDWSRRLFWYYNVDKLFVPMSRQARLESAAHDGVVSFELFLPWQDVHPYHPWLSESIGFNIGFVKAVGRSAFYYRVLPVSLGGENESKNYLPLRFADPVLPDGVQTFVRLDRNHLGRGETLTARAVTLSAAAGTESLGVSVLGGEGARLETTSAEYACGRGLTRHEFRVKLGDLPPGGYRVSWTSRRGYSRGDDSGRAGGLTVLPAAAADAIDARLDRVAPKLAPGSVTTLRFMREETTAALAALKPYETASKERMSLVGMDEMVTQAEAGRDALAERTGCFRRAFRSAVDGTLQPYAVRVPAGYDPKAGKKYPLIVYLHGSASDETNLAGVDYLSEGDCIEAAPRGRGPSNGYARDHAQEDIEEVIAAVAASYPIDRSRIVLTGFSMGGYGVYRTQYEHPERYRGLAVFSGLPVLDDVFYEGDTSAARVDFRDGSALAKFKGMPMFVFHGRQDRNCPFAATVDFVGKLEKAGARVELVTEDCAGHQRPGPETIARYHEWLRKVLRGS